MLLPLLWVNNQQMLLHLYKNFVYINSTEKRINPFEIVYMVNPRLHINEVFRE